MKRRSFVKNISLASVAAPFVINGVNMQAVTKKLFNYSKSAADRVLVIIRLNGGNDGLNTVIPIDQYDNLVIQRSNVLVPETSILPLTTNLGLHPVMTGMQSMFNAGTLSIVQNVGYPEQNRSHFRSMDIWSTGSLDPSETRGWLGRHFDNEYPNYPAAYPNMTYPDPFAISMGYEVSSTCQGLMANFSHAVEDPFAVVNLLSSSTVNDNSYFGDHMEYLATLIDQTNSYADQINTAANAGNSLATYDTTNPVAVHLRNVAKMISGGLQTKVYVLNINGFDTHDAQVSATNNATGNHADLLKMLSDAVASFQDDMNQLGLANKVAGMTFSEFGRQVAANASRGTDHGDAAPLFLFGACINGGVIGANPTISNTIVNQAGVPMQIDFRDVYASILKDWFEVPVSEIDPLFPGHVITYTQMLGACNVGIEEVEYERNKIQLFPNPATTHTSLKFESYDEWVKIEIYDLGGRVVSTVFDGNLQQDTHTITLEIGHLEVGEYIVSLTKRSGLKSIKLQKIQ